ncbi:MAG TPA: hypothetical protein VMS09_15140 [Paenibacillus sp.]|uniref:hypothetical protein n=1 Tax=Paenibacillus sp. TaxID=58172 RepID=UPI0028D0B93B|nr:hypothetical protein [Paenibacillus sp.]HUC93335.1 hypothetical protein [Paenibacillus sp.]
MDYVIFLVGSFLEYFAALVLMFALFRFRFDPRVFLNFALISFMMSHVSYFTRLNPEIGDMSSYIQLILFIVILCLLFRVSIFYSIIMNFAAFVAGFVLQGIVFFVIFNQMSGITLSELQGNQLLLTTLMIVTSMFSLAISRTLYVMNWNFDFVPTSNRTNVTIKGYNAIILVIIILSISITAITSYFFRFKYDVYVVYSILVFVISLPIFLYYAVRKDFDDAS